MYTQENVKLLGGATLTGLAQGYCSDAPLVGQYIAPVVSVECRTGAVIRFGKEAFATQDTRRAYAAKVATVSSKFSADTYTLESNALAYAIPIEVLEESNCLSCLNQSAIDLRQIETNNLVERINRGHELNVVNLVTAASTYETSNYSLTITGIVPGTNLAWDAAGSTPIRDMLALQSITRRAAGCRFNALVLGSAVYEALLTHPDVIGRIQFTTSDSVTSEILAQYFNVKSVMVADAVQLASNGDLVSIFPENAILAFYSPSPGQAAVSLTPNAAFTRATPASFYTYMKKGGFQVSPEKYFDLADNGDSAGVVRAVVSADYSVQAVSLGLNNKVNSAVYVANVFAQTAGPSLLVYKLARVLQIQTACNAWAF